MTDISRELLETFPVRKSRAQKAAFRDWLCRTLNETGWETRAEEHKSPVHSANVVAGDPETAEVILTAHYDTCAVLPIPNFITPRNVVVFLLYQFLLAAVMLGLAIGAEVLVLTLFHPPMWAALAVVYAVLLLIIWWMLAGKANKHNVNDNTSGVITLLEAALALPEETRSRVALVFFDNEEKGLLGSAAFYKKHKAVLKDKLLLNFDCVGDGEHILFFPSKTLRRQPEQTAALEAAFTPEGTKEVLVCTKGFSVYPSDQKHFPLGVGVAALHKSSGVGYWLGRIHTKRDTVLDEENIRLLTRGILSLLSR